MYFEIMWYKYHHGTYTLQADNEKGAGYLPFTGARTYVISNFL